MTTASAVARFLKVTGADTGLPVFDSWFDADMNRIGARQEEKAKGLRIAGLGPGTLNAGLRIATA